MSAITVHHEGLEEQISCLKTDMLQSGSLPFSDLLPDEELIKIVDEEVDGYRDRVFPPVVTLKGFIFQALDEESGTCTKAVARVLAERVAAGKPKCSADNGAYCRARKRLPEGFVHRILCETGAALDAQIPPEWKWQGRNVVLADGSTLSMPDTKENQEVYPQESNQKEGLGFPIARIAVLTSLGSGAVINAAIGPYKGKETGETALVRGMSYSLKSGGILLADRYHSGWFAVALRLQSGVDTVSVQHARRMTDFTRGRFSGEGHHIVYWDKPPKPAWMDADTYNGLPDKLKMRELRSRGKVIVTTLLDHILYKKKKIIELYTQRWLVEIDLLFIKKVMELGILCGKTPDIIRKEFYAGLVAYNLLRAVIAQSAVYCGLKARGISFTCALQSLDAFRKEMKCAVSGVFDLLYNALLGAIGRHKIGTRPGRQEPRRVKRKNKQFPALNKPRKEWKTEEAAKLMPA